MPKQDYFTPANTSVGNGRMNTGQSGFWRSCLWGRGPIVSIGRINCDMNAVSPKLTTAPSSTFSISTSRLKKPLRPTSKMIVFKGQLCMFHNTQSASKPRRYVSRSWMLLRMLMEDTCKKLQNCVIKRSRWTATMRQPLRTLTQARQQTRPLCSG